MKDLVTQVGKAKVKQLVTKKALLIIGGMSFSGCFIFGLIGIFVLMLFFIVLPFGFDNSLAESENEVADLQESINPRISLIQFQIKGMYPSDNDIKVNGPLIASTIQVTTLYNSSLDIENMDDDYDEKTFKNNSKFPSYSLMLDMAKGMIATKINITCTEDNPAEGAEAAINRDSYIEELVGIDGNEAKTCRPGFTQTSKTEEYFTSLDVYEKVYLPKYFVKSETLGLDAVEDAQRITDYTEDVMETYYSYRTLIYGDEGSSLEGIIYIDSEPLIADDMALPINLGVKYYGAEVTSPYGWRIHPKLKTRKFHTGIDLGCAHANPSIYAMYNGKVISTGYAGSYGNRIKIETDTDGDGRFETVTTYNHLSKIIASKGESVLAGSEIGLCGTTGRSTGNHLHFEILINGAFINPAATLDVIGHKVFD